MGMRGNGGANNLQIFKFHDLPWPGDHKAIMAATSHCRRVHKKKIIKEPSNVEKITTIFTIDKSGPWLRQSQKVTLFYILDVGIQTYLLAM